MTHFVVEGFPRPSDPTPRGHGSATATLLQRARLAAVVRETLQQVLRGPPCARRPTSHACREDPLQPSRQCRRVAVDRHGRRSRHSRQGESKAQARPGEHAGCLGPDGPPAVHVLQPPPDGDPRQHPLRPSDRGRARCRGRPVGRYRDEQRGL